MQRPSRDILYYSNYCPHSKRIIQQLVKEKDINDRLDFICIDRRTPASEGPVFVVLENGKRVPLPPNIHSVPALLLVKDQYRVIMGEEIVGYLTPAIEKGRADATGFDGEPMAASSNGASSLGFVPYGSSAGTFIPTPPETYKPNKIPENITIEMLNGQYTQDRASFEKPVM
jgi:hypothetical protein